MDTYTVDQAFEILKDKGITNSEQIVRKWLREGKLAGISPGNKRKEGWRIERSELDTFIAKKLGNSVDPIEFEELRTDHQRLLAVVEALKTENKQLIAENKVLKEEHESLKKNAPPSTSSATTEPRELTHDEVEALWAESPDRGRFEPHIQQRAYDSLMKLLFRKGNDLTALYNPKYKNPYVCPNSDNKYSTSDRLVRAMIPRLLAQMVNVAKQDAELMQMRIDDFRVYRKHHSQLPSEQLAKMYHESVTYHGFDKKEFVKRSAIVDVLVERGEVKQIKQ